MIGVLTLVGSLVVGNAYVGVKKVTHGAHVLGHKIGHELKYEPPKILHLLGMHRGHLKKDGRKI